MGDGRQNERYRTDNCGKNAAERNNPTGEEECGGIRVMGDGRQNEHYRTDNCGSTMANLYPNSMQIKNPYG